ncbi:hypothetical protein ABIB82_004434 [Bradyrhizobium sp. i1.8.4]
MFLLGLAARKSFSRFPKDAPNSWNPKLNAIEEANVALIDQAGNR